MFGRWSGETIFMSQLYNIRKSIVRELRESGTDKQLGRIAVLIQRLKFLIQIHFLLNVPEA